jgi:hypothetical protein
MDGPWVVYFQNCVRWPRPPSKMAAIKSCTTTYSISGHIKKAVLLLTLTPVILKKAVNLLLWNRWTEIGQTCQKCSLDGPLPDLCFWCWFETQLLQSHNSIDLVVSDKKIFKISANENTLWTLVAMLDFKSAPKTHIW